MSWLTEPLSYTFFVRALAAGALIGALCGAVGVFIVLRRMSYIGHGLSHSVLGGVAVGLALGVNLYLGAAAATVVSALLIDRVSRRRGLQPDAAIGVVTTAMFALGVAVISMRGGGRVSTEGLLFGNVLGVSAADLALALGVAVVFAALLFAFFKPLVFLAFDPAVARVQGVRVGATEVLFNVLTAAVVIVSVRVLGVLLVAAAVVIPAALARLLTNSFGRLLGLSIAAGTAAAVAGLYLSYTVAIPSGAAIVLVGAALFALAAAASGLRSRGRLAQAGQSHSGGAPR